MTDALTDPEKILGQLPDVLRQELIKVFNEILRNYREGRWEPSGLSGGKLCEVIYTIIKGHVDGSFPSRVRKPRNMLQACQALEQLPSASFPRSVRIQIPRILIALYEIRNNRGVGHTGGDVDPNHMDATAVLYMSKWLVGELIRIFHKTDTQAASSAVEVVVDRVIPIIWKVGGKYRVLDTGLTMKEKTLLILYQDSAPVDEGDLVEWVEHSNPSVFRRDVLRKAHKAKLIEYDGSAKTAQISPMGIRHVEESIGFNL